MVCTLTGQKMTSKCSKLCSESTRCGWWFHLSFEHILVSLVWSIIGQTMANSCRFVKSARIQTFLKLYFFFYPVSRGRNGWRAVLLNNVVLVSQSAGFTAFVQRRLDTARKVSWGELWNWAPVESFCIEPWSSADLQFSQILAVRSAGSP